MVHITGKRYAKRAGDTITVKVYSNQPSVTLFVDGQRIEEKEVHDHICIFEISLKEGMHTVVANAGVVKDSMTLEKVKEEPAIYVLPEFQERMDGVANWFKLSGDLDLNAPMEFPEGKYNIRYTMEQLAASKEALDVVSEAIFLATNFKVSPGEGMWDMMKAMSPETMTTMAGDTLPKGFLENLNAKLTKIDVV